MSKGQKTGGRQAGTLNKRTLELQALAQSEPAADSPLEFLTSVYRNASNDLDLRVDAAAKAAPYVHPKLATVTVKGDEDNPLKVVHRIDMVPVEPEPRD